MSSVKKILIAFFALTGILSCVDNDYDLRNLNTEMNLFAEEGIEIPIPDSNPSDVDIFNSENLADELFDIESESEVEEIDFSKYDSKTLQEGIKLPGEFRFSLSDLPDFLLGEESDIKFSDRSCLKMDIENGVSVPVRISFEVFDSQKNTSLGKVNDIEISVGENDDVQVSFNSLGMTTLPEEITIKNIILKVIPVKGSVSGVLKFISADCSLDTVVKKGTKLDFQQEFTDVMSGEIDIDEQYLNTKSFVFKATLISDLPVCIQASTQGDITASVTLEGPTPASGSPVVLTVKCPNGITSINKATLHLSCLFKEDIDLLDLDKYTVSITPQSLKLDEGIIIKL